MQLCLKTKKATVATGDRSYAEASNNLNTENSLTGLCCGADINTYVKTAPVQREGYWDAIKRRRERLKDGRMVASDA